MTTTTLADVIDALTEEGELYEKLPKNKLLCFACGHRCVIFDGQRGICKVRYNQEGVLKVPTRYVGALQCDPTEKKPFYHLLPGSNTLTFGMLGCDFHCGYCQNWLTSQTIRDPAALVSPKEMEAQELVEYAASLGAPVIASSYNEPLITAEWSVEVFKLAREQGLRTAFVSNGNGTPEVLEYLKPWVDGYKVDLKSMSKKSYQSLGGRLDNVLRTLKMLVEMEFWVEIVTLLVPGFNDSEEEIREAANFIHSLSSDIPWHVTAFHKDYKMTDPDNTSARKLISAAEIGYESGLRFVYAGNMPGMVGRYENTYCPGCNTPLIERFGFRVLENRMVNGGRCPECATQIPGIWT